VPGHGSVQVLHGIGGLEDGPGSRGDGQIPCSRRVCWILRWQIALIAIAAAITAAAVAVIIDRALAARRRQLVPSP
jgi:hypothetical protein